MRKLKIALPYVALAIAIIIQYYVAFNNRVLMNNENQAYNNEKIYEDVAGDMDVEGYNKLTGKIGLAKSINE